MALARKVSTEPGAKDSGGKLAEPPPRRSTLPSSPRPTVALEPGEVSQPVQTQFGWHVIYLVDKEVTPFDGGEGGTARTARGSTSSRLG